MSKQRRSVNVRLPDHAGERFEAQLRHLLKKFSKENFASRYLEEQCFSKYLDQGLVPADVRASAAVEKFMAAEARNAKVRYRLLMAEILEKDFGWTTYDKFVRLTRKIISRVLGPLRYPEVLMGSSFTNGASTRVRRGPTAAITKASGELHISDSAIKHWLAMASSSKLSSIPLLVVPSSVLFTVPKKTEIDRVACKEPEGNALLQRAIGSFIRGRLLRVGIDLRDQRRNQELARIAYDDGLATIDLSSASDTVSCGVVETLLPFEWWHLLSDLRVESTILPDGSVHVLDMFSSMGNGFTFELETLIFWAMAKATAWLTGTKGSISVYGDDIIVPSTMARRFMRLIEFFGFMPNASKSHVTGPFRESCGRHYWRGLDVTPFYIRKKVETLPELINALNHLLEWDGRGWGFFVTEELYQFWDRWRRLVPEFLWGGVSPDDPSALVTGHPPRKRLVPMTKAVGFDQQAGLITWLHRNDTRSVIADADALTPAREIGFKCQALVAAGERTSWRPDLAFS